MTRGRLIVVVATAAAAVITLLALGARGRGNPPNIILISVDTLRRDHLGCYGYAKGVSPNIDAFAREAILFERSYAHASTTRPSVASMLTGFYPHECRVMINSDNLPYLLTTIPDYLREKGYTTLAVSSNFVLGPGSGFDQGFDIFDNRLDQMELVRHVPERTADRTTDAAIGLIDGNRKGRFFLWVHYQDPHGPYTPPAPFDTQFLDAAAAPEMLPFNASLSGKKGIPDYQKIGKNADAGFYRARYDGEIGFLDVHLGRLFTALKDAGLYDNSLVILTADHGEGMGEHDYYFAHGEYLYESLIAVPLIVRWGSGRTGRRQDLVGLIDVLPTVLAAAGVKGDHALRGRNLLADKLAPLQIFSEIEDKFSLIGDRLKLIHHVLEEEIFLFDLADDPSEQRNLVGDPDHVTAARALAAQMDVARAEDHFGDAIHRVPADFSEEDKAKLKSLGYAH
jgi:arylsulfatase A-like enzyme